MCTMALNCSHSAVAAKLESVTPADVVRLCKQRLRDRAKERIRTNERNLVTIGHYSKWTGGARKNPVLKLTTCSFEVAAEYNRLRTNSKLIGRKLGDRAHDFKRDNCFWCCQSLIHTKHYLWDCEAPTIVELRDKLLLPSGEDEVRDFMRLRGATIEAKLNTYKAGILQYRPEKVIPFIRARQLAEDRRRVTISSFFEPTEEDDAGSELWEAEI